jgi:hypothetical protein
VRVDAATPINGFEFFLACQLCDLASLFEGTVIAPEVIVIQWLHVSVYGTTLEPVVSSAMEAISSPLTLVSASTCRVRHGPVAHP